MPTHKQTTLLIVLDGFGCSQNTKHNAIAQARTPFLEHLMAHQPNARIQTSGSAVGLPEGQMGNSEVGHMTMGSGRIIDQELTKINKSIKNKTFFKNTALIETLKKCEQTQSNFHIIGLLSDGGVHAHINHIIASITLASQFNIPNIYLHALLDGRDTSPKSALEFIEKITPIIHAHHHVHFASIAGRYYAMDRDQNWARTQQYFDMLFKEASTPPFESAKQTIAFHYDQNITDEFVPPTIISKHFKPLQPEDHVFFSNFRSDRARQLTQALTQAQFTGFKRPAKPLKQKHMVCMTEYKKDFQLPTAFPCTQPENTLGETLAHAKKTQLRLSETEKYAHVTFFFNGGKETPEIGEHRTLINSPKVPDYANTPEMSAPQITDECIAALQKNTYDFILINFANADMIGHTGNMQAAITAIECLDHCLQKIHAHCQNHHLLITADHGNAEKMFDEKKQTPHTAHTNYDVPIIYSGPRKTTLISGGLQDIAPTVLDLMNLNAPPQMQGKSLLI